MYTGTTLQLYIIILAKDRLSYHWMYTCIYSQRERNEDKKQVKGGAFKLNSHPKDLFDDNPYRSDRPLPPIRDPKSSKDKPKPFKPSNPAKLVSSSHSAHCGRM